jgi:hypothetical protein
MGPEDSLLYSQEPSTGPYSEPDQSSPYSPILSNIHFNIMRPKYVLAFLEIFFLLAFLSISNMHSSSPHSCYMPCQTHSPWLDLSKSSSYEAPHYAFFSNLPSLHLSSVQICFFNILSPCSSHKVRAV